MKNKLICEYCNQEVKEVVGLRKYCINCISKLRDELQKEKSVMHNKLFYMKKVYVDICKEMLELKIKLKQEENETK